MAATLYNDELCLPSELLIGNDDCVLPTEFPYDNYSLAELTRLLTRSSLHQYSPNINSQLSNFKSSMQKPKRSLFAAPAKGFNSPDLFLSHHSFSPPNHFELEKQWAIWGRQDRKAFVINQNRGNRALNLSSTLETISGKQVGPPSLGVTQQPSLRSHHRNLAAKSVGQGFVFREKKECVGTGVFIPRRYENPSADLCKKQGCSVPLLQTKPPFEGACLNQNDLIGARRNISVTQQLKHSPNLRPIAVMNNIESRLPQEWTYWVRFMVESGNNFRQGRKLGIWICLKI